MSAKLPLLYQTGHICSAVSANASTVRSTITSALGVPLSEAVPLDGL
jgi:hypothetical protein